MRESDRSGRWGVGMDWVLFVGIALLGWLLFTLDNGAPFHRHPDEPGKAMQVLGKDWNFHHPMLMVRGTERVVKVLMETVGFERTAQSVTEVGRGMVAACSALGIGALAVLARRRFGWLAALGVAVVLLTSGSVFHISHWFKEDPVLVMGWSLLLLAVHGFAVRATPGRALLVGLAGALAASGKYIGVLGLVLALVFVVVGGSRDWRGVAGRVGAFFAGAVGLLVLLNLQVFLNWGEFVAGFGREVELVRDGHHGVSRHDVPHGAYVEYLRVAVRWWVWPLAALGLAAPLLRGGAAGRRLAAVDVFLLVLLVLYAVLASLSPKVIYRYMYPVLYFLMYLAALGVAVGVPALLARWTGRRAAVAAGFVGVVVLGVWHVLVSDVVGESLRGKIAAYRLDTYAELHEWLRGELDADAVIYQPGSYHLPDPSLHMFKDVVKDFPQGVVSKGDWFESGSLDALRAAGVTHVLVRTGRHERYLGGDVTGDDDVLSVRARVAAAYRQLLDEGRVVFEMEAGPEASLHPALTVYDIRAAADGAGGRRGADAGSGSGPSGDVEGD